MTTKHAEKHDPEELVFFTRTLAASETLQEGFAVVKNLAASVHHWLWDESPAQGAAGRSADAAPDEAPPAPPPPPRNITAVLGEWSYASVPHGAAKVDPAAGATLSAAAEPFPSWHVSESDLIAQQSEPYRKRPRAPGAAEDPYEDVVPPPSHELTEAEYRALNLAPLFKHQERYNIHYGFKLPFVKRLRPDDPAVRAVLAARAALPEVPVGKGAGNLQWTEWTALGKNTRPLYGQGWMYCEDARSEYGRWLYKRWLREYVERIDKPDRLKHLAALSTLTQEGAPSSLNTYDSCIMTWGVGFACGAPQLVATLLKTPDFVNALYACGFLVQGFEPDAILKTIPGFHYQYLDLSDPEHPKVLVWDNYYHFYGYAPGAHGREISVRPRRYEGDVVNMSSNERYVVKSANPMPQANLELSYHIYNPMTVSRDKPSPVLNAFIALARDERTREAVSDANREIIVPRASLEPTVKGQTPVPIYTEAAYAFVSMCKHNWGMANAQLSRQGLSPFLTRAEWKQIDDWGKRLAGLASLPGEVRRERWPTQSADQDVLEFNILHAGAVKNPREAMACSDALIAKAVARKVMSLLEGDRVEEARKSFLKKKAALRPGERVAPVRLLDERLRKYSYLWRFSRVEKYWQEMRSGENWLAPIRAAKRLAGETDPRLAARVDKGAPEGINDPPRKVLTSIFEDGFDVLHVRKGVPNFSGAAYFAPHTMAYGADGAPNLEESTFCNLGPRNRVFLPRVIVEHGQNLELIDVEGVEFEEPAPRNGRPSKTTKYKLTWRVRPEGNSARANVGAEVVTTSLGDPWVDP
ncbi:MAG: hypothetical protein R3A48_24865 [Polyangiales bacterium]